MERRIFTPSDHHMTYDVYIDTHLKSPQYITYKRLVAIRLVRSGEPLDILAKTSYMMLPHNNSHLK